MRGMEKRGVVILLGAFVPLLACSADNRVTSTSRRPRWTASAAWASVRSPAPLSLTPSVPYA